MKLFTITVLLWLSFVFTAFLPVSYGQGAVEMPWGKQLSGLQVRIRACPKSESRKGKALMIFEVRNASEQPVEFCWWQSPLERQWAANRFKVIGPEGEVAYEGAMIKRTAPSKKSGDYTTLRSGWTLGVEFDLAEAYRMKAGRKYSIRFEGTNLGPLPASNKIEFELR